MLILAPTDALAHSKWQHYCTGIDNAALTWVHSQATSDTHADQNSTVKKLVSSTGHKVNMNQGTLIGSYESVAEMLDQIAEVDGVKGVMLTFDDFEEGVDAFGREVLPRLKCRDIVVEKKKKRKRGEDGEEAEAGEEEKEKEKEEHRNGVEGIGELGNGYKKVREA